MLLNKSMPLAAILAIAGMVLVTTITTRSGREAERQPARPTIHPAENATSRPAGSPGIAHAPTGARSRQAASRHLASSEPTPQEQESIMAAQVADLDQKLRADPLDPAWARKQEEVIAQALAGTPHDGLPAVSPDRMDTSCHSTLCRIRMTYADEEDAMQMHTKLSLGLHGSIATARAFYRPNQNGGMDLLVFAGAVD